MLATTIFGNSRYSNMMLPNASVGCSNSKSPRGLADGCDFRWLPFFVPQVTPSSPCPSLLHSSDVLSAASALALEISEDLSDPGSLEHDAHLPVHDGYLAIRVVLWSTLNHHTWQKARGDCHW
jgi:hypothetical protein